MGLLEDCETCAFASRVPSTVLEEAMKGNPKLAAEARGIAATFKCDDEGKDDGFPRAIGFHYVVVGNKPDYERGCFFFYLDSYLGQEIHPLVVEEGKLRPVNEAVSTLRLGDVVESEQLGLLTIPKDEATGRRYHAGVVMGTTIIWSHHIESKIALIFRDHEIVGVLEKCLAKIGE